MGCATGRAAGKLGTLMGRHLSAKRQQAKQRGNKYRQISLAYAQGMVHSSPSRASRQIAASDQNLEYIAYINSPEWAVFRAFIIRKRGRRCQQCGTTEGEMNLHHKHYRTFGHERSRDVLLLCRPCHDALHRLRRMG